MSDTNLPEIRLDQFSASDRELLTAVFEHEAVNLFIHLDDCENDACQGCDPQHLAEKAAAKSTARDELLLLDASGEWPAYVDRILAKHRTEVLADEAERNDSDLKSRVTRAIHALKTPAPDGSQHYRSGWDDGVDASIDAARAAIEAGESRG